MVLFLYLQIFFLGKLKNNTELLTAYCNKNNTKEFPLRMYTYHSRIFDKYHRRITAYAILTDAVRKKRPNRFVSE